jgi:hypothetical protein
MVSLEIFIHIILPAALGPVELTQPQTEMSTGIFPEGKGGQCTGLTTLPPSYADCHEIGESQTLGTVRV